MALDGYVFSDKKIRIVTVEALLQYNPKKDSLQDEEHVITKITNLKPRRQRLSMNENSISLPKKRLKISTQDDDSSCTQPSSTYSNEDFRSMFLNKL